MVHEHIVGGEQMFLVQPLQMGCAWTQENKIFRSSLWSSDGELVSAGFPKFVNWGEKPEVFPVPESLKDCYVAEKLDGSLLIVSKWKGNHILRTRGTSDATKLENGYELETFKQNFLPKLDELMRSAETWNESVLFEWVSPKQKIVINYGDEPQWFLVGSVGHSRYELAQQIALDDTAACCGWKRPDTYNVWNAMGGTPAELLASVNEWKGKEGVCVYSNGGQTIHKVKSAWYLYLHRMKSELSSLEKVIDVWLEMGKPDYQTFYNNIATQFDFELAEQCRGFISQICDGNKEVNRIIAGMQRFVDTQLKPLPTRKLQAVVTFQSYAKNSNRSQFVFKLLDGKELDKDDIKKLMFQVLK